MCIYTSVFKNSLLVSSFVFYFFVSFFVTLFLSSSLCFCFFLIFGFFLFFVFLYFFDSLCYFLFVSLFNVSLFLPLTQSYHAGYEVRIVGGAVRDVMQDKPPKDIDMATNATPDQMIDLCKEAGVKHILTGEKRATVNLT